MPRPKGSKNKTKTVKATVDFAAQIAEKQSAKEAAAAEIASITANIDALKADLKTKKAELKSIDKEIARIETSGSVVWTASWTARIFCRLLPFIHVNVTGCSLQ